VIEESAMVTRTADGIAWVQTQRKTACGGCSLNKGCGVSVLDKLLGDRSSILQVINPVSAEQGDEVVIGIREDALVTGSLVVYMIPLLTMILFAVFGAAVVTPWVGFSAEGISIVMALLGLIIGFGWVSGFSRRVKHDFRYQPVILRKTGHMPDCIPISGISN